MAMLDELLFRDRFAPAQNAMDFGTFANGAPPAAAPPGPQFGGPVDRPGGAAALQGILSRMFAGSGNDAGFPTGLPSQGAAPQQPTAPPTPAWGNLSPFMAQTPMNPPQMPQPAIPASSPDVSTPVPVRPGDQYTGVSPGDPGARRAGRPASGDAAPVPAPAPSAAPNIPPTSLAGRLNSEAPGIGDRIMAGIMGLTQAKSPMQGVGQMVGGLASGQRQDPVGIQQQGYADAYKALTASGIPPQQAMAAIAAAQAGHPEILHATAEQFGLPKAQQTGEDMLGNKQFAVPGGTNMNPNFQTPQVRTPAQAAIARQPEAFQRQMFFRGHGTVYQGADGHVLRRVGDKIIDTQTGQEVRG